MAEEKTSPAVTSATASDAPKTATAVSPAHVDKKDDMHDEPWEMTGTGLVPQALQFLLEKVSTPYWTANADAIRFQSTHHRITMAALVTGTAAVTAAIFELLVQHRETGEVLEHWLAIAELALAIVAAVCVVAGVIEAVQKKWLLERHKAERLRFLKYRSLLLLATDPNPTRDLENWKLQVLRDVRDIEDMDEDELKRWWMENRRIAKDEASLTPTVSDTELNAIMEYYKRKRLEKQIQYFFRKSQRTSASDAVTRLLPPFFFVLSIFCAVSHVFIDFYVRLHYQPKTEPPWLDTLALILIVAAAVLPVWGAAIRTHRSANEFSRNTVRFTAMYHELDDAAKALVPSAKPVEKMRKLWQSEEALEDEHREWLRLMDEAEWYG